MKELIEVNNITEAHKILGLAKPSHPLVSVFSPLDMHLDIEMLEKVKISVNLHQVWMNDGVSGSVGYGRNDYDFHEGTLAFFKPGQVLTYHEKSIQPDSEAWGLLFHPDLIRKSELGRTIESYSFFDYEINEALHISDAEKKTLNEIKDKIVYEYSLNIDKHSQKLIVSNIELLLDYCTRYYDRQFYTRTNLNKDLVTSFEHLLRDYYKSGKPLEAGIPTVAYCGSELNMSSSYLSDLLKKETGKNAQEHIHHFVIDKAKTQLLGTTESISQIAYGLGFEYPQHFSKMFKAKAGVSPAEYRSMN